MIRVVLADDHPVVLAGVKALLHAVPDIDLVGEATTGPSALAIVQELCPEIVVLDISMPGINGIDLARQAAEACPETRVLVLTAHEDRAYVREMLEAGARGYLLKRSAADELVRAVRAVAEGGLFLDPAIAGKALPGHPTTEPRDARALSPREEDVLRQTALGLSNKEIAGRLGVSTKTVETYKARGMEKLGLRTRSHIVRFGVRRRWLDD